MASTNGDGPVMKLLVEFVEKTMSKLPLKDIVKATALCRYWRNVILKPQPLRCLLYIQSTPTYVGPAYMGAWPRIHPALASKAALARDRSNPDVFTFQSVPAPVTGQFVILKAQNLQDLKGTFDETWAGMDISEPAVRMVRLLQDDLHSPVRREIRHLPKATSVEEMKGILEEVLEEPSAKKKKKKKLVFAIIVPHDAEFVKGMFGEQREDVRFQTQKWSDIIMAQASVKDKASE